MKENELEQIFSLCAIAWREEEKSVLRREMKKILHHIEKMQEVDTEGVEPCCHVIEKMQNVCREDVPEVDLDRKFFLDHAPQQVGGMVRVPSVIEGKNS